MKKKSLIILSILILSLALTACSPEAKEYLKLTQNIQKWEAFEQEGTIVVNMKLPESLSVQEGASKEDLQSIVESKVTIDMKAYSNNNPNNPESRIIMDMKDESGKIDVKNIELLVNKDKIFMSRNYVESILAIDENIEVDIPENIKYFAMDSGFNTDEYLAMATMYNNQEYIKFVTEIFQDLELDFDIKKESNTFTIDLDSDKMVDLLEQFIKNLALNSEKVLDKLENVEGLGFTKEDIEDMKADFKDISLEELKEMKDAIDEVKPLIKGSKIHSKETFNANNYKMDFDMVLKVDGFVDMEMSTKTISKKVDKKDPLVFPNQNETMDYMEFVESIAPTYHMVDIDIENKKILDFDEIDFDKMEKEISIKSFDNVEMYGFRKIFEALNFEVGYDGKADKAFYILDGENKILDIPIEKGIAYIGIEKMKELGLEVDYDEENKMIYIIYTEKPKPVAITE